MKCMIVIFVGLWIMDLNEVVDFGKFSLDGYLLNEE